MAKRLSDAQIAKLAKEHKAIDDRIKALKKKQEKRKDAIIKELSKRGTKAVESHGVRVNKVQGEMVTYHLDQLREALPRPKLRLITEEVVSKERLSQAVQSGKIKLDVVSECSTVKLKAPYITVTPTDE